MYRRGLALSPLRAIVLVMAILLASHIFLFTLDSNLLFCVHVISGLYWYGLVFEPDWGNVV